MLGNDNENVKSNNITVPGKEVAITNEGIFKTTDDYGDAYYYRGKVDNNYLVFDNSCWRIVRTTGNGGIKIILYSYMNTNCSYSSSGAAFIKNGQIPSFKFNTSSNGNGYVGLRYGAANDPGGIFIVHNNQYQSNILKNMNSFYGLLSTNNKDKLMDVIWCNDKNPVPGYSGVGLDDSYYAGYARLVNSNIPSLICTDDVIGSDNYSKFTVEKTDIGNGDLDYPIGLLTADEAAYAGLVNNTAASDSYLTENATALSWWTMTPHSFKDGAAYEWSVSTTGALSGTKVDSFLGLRVALTLKPNSIATGTGTKTDPYVVK